MDYLSADGDVELLDGFVVDAFFEDERSFQTADEIQNVLLKKDSFISRIISSEHPQQRSKIPHTIKINPHNIEFDSWIEAVTSVPNWVRAARSTRRWNKLRPGRHLAPESAGAALNQSRSTVDNIHQSGQFNSFINNSNFMDTTIIIIIVVVVIIITTNIIIMSIMKQSQESLQLHITAIIIITTTIPQL